MSHAMVKFMHMHADEAHDAAAEKRRLQEQHRSDRRMREQHAAMLQSVHALKQQVEAELTVRRRLEADLAELRAKVSSCATIPNPSTLL
jgi:hypothetical protein